MTDLTDDYAGFVTRAIAFAIDIAIIDVAAAFVGIVVGLGLSALDVPDAVKTVAVAVGAVAFIAWSVGYFATFWAAPTATSPWASKPRSCASWAWCSRRSRCAPASC